MRIKGLKVITDEAERRTRTNPSSFLKGVATLISGTIIAQGLGIVLTPFIMRVYSPHDFGLLSYMLALVSILGTIACGRYELAIVLPEDDGKAKTLAQIGIVLSAIITIVTTMTLLAIKASGARLFGLDKLAYSWIGTIGVMIFLSGLELVIQRLAIRSRSFQTIAKAQVLQIIISNAVKLGLGLLGFGLGGLVVGTLAGQAVSIAIVSISVRRMFGSLLKGFDAPSMRVEASRYRKFPLISSWGALLSAGYNQFPVLVLGSRFSLEVTGNYSLASKMLNLPVSIISQSVGTVFSEGAARAASDKDGLKRLVLSTYVKILAVGAVGFSTVAFYGEPMFLAVFGKEWADSGIYARLLSFGLITQIVAAPLSMIYSITERQGEGLLWQAAIFLTGIVTIVPISLILRDPMATIAFFSLGTFIIYGAWGIRMLSLVGVDLWQGIWRSGVILGLVFCVQAFIYFSSRFILK